MAMAGLAFTCPNCFVTRWNEKSYNPEMNIINPNSALFFLGEPFRLSILGDNSGEENDEDSVINDLEYYLGNYEAD